METAATFRTDPPSLWCWRSITEHHQSAGRQRGLRGEPPPPLISELLREFRRRGSHGKLFPFGNKPSEVRTPNSDPRASARPETTAAGACQIWPQVQGPGGSRGSPRPPWEGVAAGVAPAKRGNPFCLIPIGALWQLRR